jgi:hypothetical protein
VKESLMLVAAPEVGAEERLGWHDGAGELATCLVVRDDRER